MLIRDFFINTFEHSLQFFKDFTLNVSIKRQQQRFSRQRCDDRLKPLKTTSLLILCCVKAQACILKSGSMKICGLLGESSDLATFSSENSFYFLIAISSPNLRKPLS